MWSFPARFLVQFFENHGMLGLTRRPAWQTIVGSSRVYVEAICARLGERLHLGSPVIRVRRTRDGLVDVTAAGRAPERFDDVVLACHSDQALAMLADPTAAERAVLGAIRYHESELVLHSDERLLPRRRAARASWNAHLVDPAPAAPTLTYDLRRLQGLETSLPILATLNLGERVDPATVHARLRFAHPVFTPRRSRPSAATARSAASIASTSRGPTGRGASTRTVWPARTGSRPPSAPALTTTCDSRHDGVGPLHRHRAPPPLRRPASRVPAPGRVRLPGPGRAADPPRRPARSPQAGVVRLRRRDLLGGPGEPRDVRAALGELIAARTGRDAPDGPVRVLTHPRTLGTCFNPVSFYYLFDADERLDTVGRRGHQHAVGRAPCLRAARRRQEVLRGAHPKALHVSPFLAMERRHEWAVGAPGRTLSVHIEDRRLDGGVDFDASLSLRREELTPRSLRAFVARHPGGTLRVLA